MDLIRELIDKGYVLTFYKYNGKYWVEIFGPAMIGKRNYISFSKLIEDLKNIVAPITGN